MDTRVAGRILIILALMALAGTALAQAPNLADVLKATGLKYSELEGTTDSWRVPFDAKEGKALDVFVTYNDEKKQFALLFATVVDREDKFNFSREVLVEAMKLSNDYPGVKFVLDEDHGDIDCQSEVYMPTITAESLAMYINLVASMSDENMTKLDQLAGGAAEGAIPATAVPTGATTTVEGIKWMASYQEAIAAAAAENKPIIVDFMGVNCGACERMDAVTYADPQVMARAADFIMVKVDVEKRQDLMTKYNVIVLPTTVVFSPEGKEARRAEGYLDPPAMLKLMGEALQ